jgi:PST family polysaccharide transporter
MTTYPLEPDAASLKQRSVRGIASTAGAQAVRALLQVGSVIVLSRLLAPAEFGLVAMVMPLIGLVLLFNEFGLNHAVVQQRTVTLAELSALFWANLAISAVLALAVVAAAPLLARLYAEPRVAPIAASLALLLLLGGMAAQPLALLSRRMRFGALSAIDVAGSLVGVATGILAALAGLGAWALVAMLLANALAILVLAWRFAGWRPGPPRREPGVAALLRFGGSVTGANLVAHLAYSVDKVLVGLASGPAALGFYERAGRLTVQPMWQAIMPVARVAVPLLSRLQDDRDRYRAAYLRLLGAMLAATVPGLVCAIVLAEPVVVMLLGAPWRDAAPILAAMAAGTLLAPIGISLGWLFISQGRPREQLAWGTAASLLVVAGYGIGLPWGAVGVATAASAMSWLLATPLQGWAATRRGPVGPRDLLGCCWPFILVGLGVAAALRAAAPLAGGFEGWRLLLAPPLAYAVALAVLAMLPPGRRLLRDAWALLPRAARPAPAEDTPPGPPLDLSIVVCTFNRAPQLEAMLRTAASLRTTRAVEVLVVDNASSDDTPGVVAEAASRDPRLRRMTVSRRGLGAARDAAWRAARGRIVAFTDDDCYLAEDYADAMLDAFARNPDAGCIGGRILLHDPADAPETIDERDTAACTPPCRFIDAGAVHGANLAFRREALVRAGGFDAAMGAGTSFPCEDIDAAAAVLWSGRAVCFDPAPVVRHHHGRRLHEVPALFRRYDRGRGAYYAKYLLRRDSRAAYRRGWWDSATGQGDLDGLVRVTREARGALAYLRHRRAIGALAVALAAGSLAYGWIAMLIAWRILRAQTERRLRTAAA